MKLLPCPDQWLLELLCLWIWYSRSARLQKTCWIEMFSCGGEEVETSSHDSSVWDWTELDRVDSAALDFLLHVSLHSLAEDQVSGSSIFKRFPLVINISRHWLLVMRSVPRWRRRRLYMQAVFCSSGNRERQSLIKACFTFHSNSLGRPIISSTLLLSQEISSALSARPPAPVSPLWWDARLNFSRSMVSISSRRCCCAASRRHGSPCGTWDRFSEGLETTGVRWGDFR